MCVVVMSCFCVYAVFGSVAGAYVVVRVLFSSIGLSWYLGSLLVLGWFLGVRLVLGWYLRLWLVLKALAGT